MMLKVCTLELLSEEANQIILDRLGLPVEYIDRSQLSSLKVNESTVLICRDRDNWNDIFRVFPFLRFVFILSAGVEKLPFDELLKRNIVVTNPGGINAPIMSEYAMGIILSHSIRLVENLNNKISHFWKKFQCVDSLSNQKLLIVGAGRTGQLLAHKAKAFGMNVIGVKKHICELPNFDEIVTISDIKRVLPLSDFVVCTIPLTDDTRGLFNGSLFECMKQTSYFINISRSRIVVTDDLVKSLKNGTICGACLDVFDKEPLDENDELWNVPNLIITPHSSGRLEKFTDKTIPYFIKNVKAFVSGTVIPNKVNLYERY